MIPDWHHAIQREGVNSRPELQRRLELEPQKCKGRFADGDTADAMLAATGAWLADQAGIQRPEWTKDPERVSETPWFGSPARGWLLAHTPAHFRQRNLFTIPEMSFTPRAGCPQVSEESKRRKARARQKAYRRRIRNLVAEARATQTQNEGK